MEISVWVKEVISGTILLIIVYFIFRNGGNDFNQIATGFADGYVKSVTTLQGR